MIIWPLSFALPAAYRAAGDAKACMYTSIVSMWIFPDRIQLSGRKIYGTGSIWRVGCNGDRLGSTCNLFYYPVLLWKVETGAIV